MDKIVNLFKYNKNLSPMQKIISIICIILVVALVLVTAMVIRNKQNYEGMAKGPRIATKAVLSISVVNANVSSDSQVSININLVPQNISVTAVDLKINYPTDKFSFVSLVPTSCLPQILTQSSNTNNLATIILGSKPEAPVIASCTIAVLTLQPLPGSTGTAQVYIDPTTEAAAIGFDNNISSFSTKPLRLQIR